MVSDLQCRNVVLAFAQAVVVPEAGWEVRRILLASGWREAVGRSKERVERVEAVGIRFLFIGRLRVGSQAGLCLKVLCHAGSLTASATLVCRVCERLLTNRRRVRYCVLVLCWCSGGDFTRNVLGVIKIRVMFKMVKSRL